MARFGTQKKTVRIFKWSFNFEVKKFNTLFGEIKCKAIQNFVDNNLYEINFENNKKIPIFELFGSTIEDV